MEPPSDYAVAVVSRIIKGKLPKGSQLTRGALTTVNRAAVVFTMYLTTCALEEARSNNRQTISVSDVEHALDVVMFSEFIEPVEKAVEARKKEQIASRKERLSNPGEKSKQMDETEVDDEVEEMPVDIEVLQDEKLYEEEELQLETSNS